MTEGRARLLDLGIRLGRLPPGPTDSIRDVPGLGVGQVTLVEGEGELVVGRGPVRTGLTVVLPPGDGPWPASPHIINGFGKTAGLLQVAELKELESPIFLTNTLSVGAVLEGYLQGLRSRPDFDADHSRRNVLVAECNDGYLNDLWGLHVRPHHVQAALADARANTSPTDGAIGAGTGMAAFGLKGGLGSASRRLSTGAMVAAMVLLNCGEARDLRFWGYPLFPEGAKDPGPRPPEGSVIIVIVTDAAVPLPTLDRMAARSVHGLARTGATSQSGSGDIALAVVVGERPAPPVNELFLGTIEAVEAAVWNALLAAAPMVGRDGHGREALDGRLLLSLYRRGSEDPGPEGGGL